MLTIFLSECLMHGSVIPIELFHYFTLNTNVSLIFRANMTSMEKGRIKTYLLSVMENFQKQKSKKNILRLKKFVFQYCIHVVTQSKTASIESPVKKETTKQNGFLTSLFQFKQSIFYVYTADSLP